MRPGQLEPNELEMAVLRAFALCEPRIVSKIQKLHVLSREFTGVGSFTHFQFEGSDLEHVLDLVVQIGLPGVATGLGALLRCNGDNPTCLELYTYGDELWDGVYDGFSIAQPRNQSVLP